jgi:hypothetical protein
VEQLVPASTPWWAIFATIRASGAADPATVRHEQVICWGLVQGQVLGLVARERVVPAEWDPLFLGYSGSQHLDAAEWQVRARQRLLEQDPDTLRTADAARQQRHAELEDARRQRREGAAHA